MKLINLNISNQMKSPNKSYKQEANPNATNSELDAKIVVKNDKEKEEDLSPYDKIPKRY